jgi:hypothetical protein
MEVKVCTSPSGECVNRKDDGECLVIGECIRIAPVPVPVVTTTPPLTEMKPETQAAVIEMAGKAAEMIKAESPAAVPVPSVVPGPVELIPEKAPVAATPVKKAAESTRIKIVITHYNGAATVGIQRTGTDPVFFIVPGAILDASKAMPDLLIRASKQWQVAAKNPVAVLPAPAPVVPRPATARQTTPARPSTPAKPAAPKVGVMKPMM